MDLSRRLFIRNGVATVSLGFAAPEFLTAIAQAQGLPSRRLVVVYLGGGNDALNTLVPYLDALPRPVDALAAWNTSGETPRALLSAVTGVPAIQDASSYTFASPNRGSAAVDERTAAEAMASNPATGRPHLAFVNSTSRGAIETIDRVAQATTYKPTIAYPNNGFALALKTVAGAIAKGL